MSMTHTTQVLSDEQIFIDWCKAREESTRTSDQVRAFARAIESATLKAVSEREPVAWRWMPSQEFPMWVYSDDKNRVMEALRFMGHGGVQPLYTLPPAQPAPVDERETRAQKHERNWRVQSRYNELMRDGYRGHYEAMFRVVQEEVEAARAALQCAQAPQPTKGGEA